MTTGNPRFRVVEMLCDVYVEQCERIEAGLDLPPFDDGTPRPAPPLVLPRTYQPDAFLRAIDVVRFGYRDSPAAPVRPSYRDLTGDEILAAEDAVLTLYSRMVLVATSVL